MSLCWEEDYKEMFAWKFIMPVFFIVVPRSWSKGVLQGCLLFMARGGVHGEHLLQSWWLEGRIQTVPRGGSYLRAVLSVAHLIQISISTVSISSGSSYELRSIMEMHPQSCSSVFSQPVDPPPLNLASVVKHLGKVSSWGSSYIFFLKEHGNLRSILSCIWAEGTERLRGVLLEVLSPLQHCRTITPCSRGGPS